MYPIYSLLNFGTVEFSSEIGISLNFTAEHTEQRENTRWQKIYFLYNKKAGAGVPYNKTPEDIETKIVQIATDNKELDANDIWNIVTELYGFDKTVRT
jgi:hypothetical protein